MPHIDRRRQPGDGGVEEVYVVVDVVRGGVAGTQHHRQRVAGAIATQQRRQPVAALEMRGRAGFVFAVNLHQRRVDVQHHRRRSAVGRATRPHLFAHRRPGRPQVLHRRRVQRAHRAIGRRRRRHRAEQALLGAQILDIGARLPAAGEHQHRLGQHLAPIMDRRPLTRPPHTRRQRRRRTQPISKRPQRVQPHMTNQPAAAALYPHLTHTVRLHLGDASLSGIAMCLIHVSSHVREAFPRTRTPTTPQPVNNQG